MTHFGPSETGASGENISRPTYILTERYVLGGDLDDISDEEVPRSNLTEEFLNEEDTTVAMREDESENREDRVELRSEKVEEREDEVEEREDEVEEREDEFEEIRSSPLEEDIEAGKALAACAPEDDDEDLTEREDYQKVMADILKEFGCDIVDYEKGLEACMVEFVTDYVYSVIEDASLYSLHAEKKEIDVKDVQLAMSMLQVKNKASSWAPELAQSFMKQRAVLHPSSSTNFSLPKSPHESQTASTSNADVPLDSQEKDSDSTITEEDKDFDKDKVVQTKESESSSSSRNASPTCAGFSLNTDEDHPMDTDDPSMSGDSDHSTIEYVDLSTHRYEHFFTNIPRRDVHFSRSQDTNEDLSMNTDENLSMRRYSDSSTSTEVDPSTSRDANTSASRYVDDSVNTFSDLFPFMSGDEDPYDSKDEDSLMQVLQGSSSSSDSLMQLPQQGSSTSSDS